ncbi:MAG: formylmethanofuran dehydrogenase [Betaproteobacteria bacterium HGW-Betaproteobacteria-21]|nr:MAG: formylmethanofuran dehydrogenase [Betaproteobacteria bacterium HGW-Betaproteobacteria-21]
MTATLAPVGPAASGQPWTCPFCPLLCDGFTLDASRPALVDSACPTAAAALAHFGAAPLAATALVDGQVVDAEQALAAAADILAASRQPLFAGLATDVAGMRALYRLANDCGAILDHVRGDALMHSTRALQDRGVFYTTLAEIRNRADLVLCLGTNPAAHYPEFFRRCAPAADATQGREIVFLGARAATEAVGLEGCTTEEIPLAGDLFDTVALLAARLAGRRVGEVPAVPAVLEALVARMQAARYTVIVWESASLPAHGALIAEGIQRLVNTLNRSTRAAAFCCGGGDGGYTANQVLTWLSGLPLRSGVHARGLVHEPLRYATDRLLADAAVDALLWVSSFGLELVPPAIALPRVVLGHPGLGARLAQREGKDEGQREGQDGGQGTTVFIPVSTPGIGSAGHLFRADGGVVVPLAPIHDDPLPTVAEVAAALCARLARRRAIAGGAQ